jgi:ankyrin repeat protein
LDDVDEVRVNGLTPLLFAAQNRNPEIAGIFIDAGADVNYKVPESGGPFHGLTSLIIASGRNDNPEVPALLIERGALVNTRDAQGKTAWDYLQQNEFLREAEGYERLEELFR